MKYTFCLYMLLLGLVTSVAEARSVSGPASAAQWAVVQPGQGDKTPPAQSPEQSSPEPPVKTVPMTERKSKPQRVETGEARGPGSARGPREVRSARGRNPEAGRGAQGGGRGAQGGSRGASMGRGRGH